MHSVNRTCCNLMTLARSCSTVSRLAIFSWQRKASTHGAKPSAVVLLAGKVAGKVYRETLAVPSAVFQSLFQFPPMDGCPVVKVEDSPKDFRHLLRLLFPRPTTDDAEIPFRHVSVYVTLAHRYKMGTILEDGLKLLMKYYDVRHDLRARRDMGALEVSSSDAIDAIYIA
ncbi:hypothetical protein C8T65DRAFT_670043 [Cerioporus squamosus]|nr:hypothetical protein C8T65DRAFT_670043 [Cerioporus squamosus]